MIGKRFGRLVVIEESKERQNNGSIRYLCKCDCGNMKNINGVALRLGKTVSCGCYNREIITKDECKADMPLYGIHHSMKQRCYNTNDKAYKNYGNRGIKVCDEWKDDFEAFKKWSLENGYKKGLWLDRIDNDKNYSPDNCRWATPKEQQRNKRTSRFVEINGVKKTVSEWAEEFGIGYATISRRLELGWKPEDLSKPVDRKRSHSKEIREAINKSNPRTEVTIERAGEINE